MTDAPEDTSPSSRRNGGRVALLALFAGAIGAFFLLDGPSYLNLDTIKSHRDALLALTQAHYVPAMVAAVLVYITATTLSLPTGLVLSLTIGFLFGRWVGAAIVIVGATIGGTMVFLAARYLFADSARRRMGPMGRRIADGFSANAFSYLLFLRLVPFPYFLVNLAPAFTAIKVRTFVAATAIGIIPGTFVFVNLGQALGRIESTQQLLSLETLGALALLGCLALTPVLIKRWKPGLGPKF